MGGEPSPGTDGDGQRHPGLNDMGDISRDEFNRLYETLDGGFRGIHDRLDRQNGRIGQTEQKIAVLEATTGQSKKTTAALGGGVGLFAVGAIEAFKAWFHK